MFNSIRQFVRSKVLFLNPPSPSQSYSDQRMDEVLDRLADLEIDSLTVDSIDAAEAVVFSDPEVHLIMVNWTAAAVDEASAARLLGLMQDIKRRDPRVPIVLLADRPLDQALIVDLAGCADEFVWTLEDFPPFIAQRVMLALEHYLDDFLPPLTRTLMEYRLDAEYPWAAPGHQGGVAYSRSRIGHIFKETYGEEMFRNDMGIERAAIGSLLEHVGPIGDSERYAAKVFGADQTYCMLNGTSGSNRTIFAAAVGEGQIAICDRNCHKSIEQGLIATGGIPVYLQARRNRYGVIGPIHPDQLAPDAIVAKIAANPIAAGAADPDPVYAVITNCTYDGMCYNSAALEDLLKDSVNRIHLDEAWYAYARFHPVYADHYGLRGDPKDHPKDAPTIFVTHSTHKMLAALSQSSFIHVRPGKDAISEHAFNEAYCAQSSTSPFYPMIASNEISAAMMDHGAGETLIGDTLAEAVRCRQTVMRVAQQYRSKGDWFFDSWNAPTVTDSRTGETCDFVDAPVDLLVREQSAWVLKPGAEWHGFDHLPDDWCMLDPLKYGVLCPGMSPGGQLEEWGIPGDIVTAYISRRGIVPSRTTPHMVLFLFSMGVTKGKWGTLVNALIDFKRDYDANTPIDAALPDIVAMDPDRYSGYGLRDFADEMWADMRRHNISAAESLAYEQLPEMAMLPRAANQQFIRGKSALVDVDHLAGRISAVGVIPYPPGIPIVMPGERFGADDGATLNYIRALETWWKLYPGFEKVIEGAVMENGRYYFNCLTE